MHDFPEFEEFQEQISNYVDIIEQATPRIEDVRATFEAIRINDGVSKKMMVSFEDILSEDIPLASFTKNPTHTNLKETIASLEAINWGLIISIVTAVAGLIIQVIQWVMGQKNEKRLAKQYEKSSKELKESLDELSKKVENPQVNSFREQYIEEAEKKYSPQWNRYSEECVVLPGRYINTLFSIRQFIFEDVITSITDLKDFYDNILKGNVKQLGDGLNYNSVFMHPQLEVIMNTLEIRVDQVNNKLASIFGGKIKLAEADKYNFSRVINEVSSKRSQLMSEPAEIPFSLHRLGSTVIDKKSGILGSIDNPEWHRSKDRKLGDRLKAVENIAKELKSSAPKLKHQDHAEETIALVRATMTGMQSLAQGIGSYVALLENALVEQEKWIVGISQAFKKIAEYE